jgi:L-lactate dehydrogenase complex protein LldG
MWGQAVRNSGKHANGVANTLILQLEKALSEVDATLHMAGTEGVSGLVVELLKKAQVTNAAFSSDHLLNELKLEESLGREGVETMAAPGREIDAAEYGVWREEVADRGAGITSATGIAAETGTLLLAPLIPDQRAVSLLPDKHIAVIPESCVVASIDKLFDLGQKSGNFDGNAVFVTGPSRTADIEKELVLGVHGPRSLDVILVEGI